MPPVHAASKRPACLGTGSLIICMVLLLWLGSFSYFIYSRGQPKLPNPSNPPTKTQLGVEIVKPDIYIPNTQPPIVEKLLKFDKPQESTWLPQYNGEKLHIVFSTDCSYFQDWQTLLMFHSAMVIHQPGDITRIASGCTEEHQKELLDLYKVQAATTNMHSRTQHKCSTYTNIHIYTPFT